MPSWTSKLLLTLIVGCAACAPRAAETGTTVPAGGTPVTAPPAALPRSTESPTVAAVTAAAPATPRPAPRFFTEAFDGPVPYWIYQQAGNSQPIAAPEIRDGFLVFDLAVPDQWGYAVYGGPNIADVSIEARVQDRTGGDGAAGVLCRYDKTAGWYELDVFSDGTFQLLYGRWLAAGVASYTPLYRGQAEGMQADENTIGLQCQGDSLSPSLNGHPLRKWQEQKFGLRQGKVGLSASSFVDAPVVVAFDSVKVSEP